MVAEEDEEEDEEEEEEEGGVCLRVLLPLVSPAAVPMLSFMVVVMEVAVSSTAESAVVMSISIFLFILLGGMGERRRRLGRGGGCEGRRN